VESIPFPVCQVIKLGDCQGARACCAPVLYRCFGNIFFQPQVSAFFFLSFFLSYFFFFFQMTVPKNWVVPLASAPFFYHVMILLTKEDLCSCARFSLVRRYVHSQNFTAAHGGDLCKRNQCLFVNLHAVRSVLGLECIRKTSYFTGITCLSALVHMEQLNYLLEMCFMSYLLSCILPVSRW